MAEFLEQQDSLFLGMEEWQPPIRPKAQINAKEEEEDIQYALGLTEAELANQKKLQDISNERIDVGIISPVNFQGLLTEALGDEAPLDALMGIGSKKTEYDAAIAKGDRLTAADIENAKDPLVSATLFRFQHRASRAQERLLDVAEQFEGGLADKVYEFLDQAVYDTYASFRDIGQGITGGGTEETTLTQEWLAAMTGMDDDEFDKWVDERIASLADRSTREPSWQVYRELRALESAGFIRYDQEWGLANSVLSGFDAATLGVAGVTKLGRIGKSLIGRLRSTAGTKAATAAAERIFTGTDLVVRGGLDGEILDEQLLLENMSNRVTGTTAKTTNRPFTRPKSSFTIKPNIEDAEIVEDIIPSAYASKARTVNVTPPPVSNGAIKFAQNFQNIKASFLKREARGSFGMTGRFQAASQWAEEFGREVAKANSTKVIDFDIADEGLQNFKATWRLGKDGGKPFETFDAASAIASKIPNARVIDTRTGKVVANDTGSKQFAIQFDQRYVGETRPLDMSQVKEVGLIGRWFGSAGRGSNSFFNSLADASEFGGTIFREEVRGIFDKFGALTNDEQRVLSDIITYLRDDAKVNTWYGTSEFMAQYKGATGQWPRAEVVRYYEDLVQASDFSWFVMASERLRYMAKRKSLMWKYKNDEHVIYPVETKATSKAYNASTGQMVDPKDIPEGTQIYKLAQPKKGWPQFVFNTMGQTRLPELVDAFPYNSGGPRLNPEIQYFVGTAEDGWATALGAKTRKQAEQAVKEINNINAAFMSVFRGKVPENPLAGLTKAETNILNNAIKANRTWKPDLETITDYVEFMKGRGLSIANQVIFKERNAKVETFIEFADDFFIGKDLSALVSYSRHDMALIEFGGERAANPDPVMSIVNQFNSAIDEGARIQYKIEHLGAWAEALWRYSDPKNGGEVLQIEGLGPFTHENLARNVVIKGNTPLARKLRQEQSVIVRRLNMLDGSTSESPIFSSMRGTWDRAANALLEATYGLDNKWINNSKVAAGIRNLRDGTSGGLLSYGFFMKMASPIQLLLQGSMAIQITAVSPKNGFRGSMLSGFIREMARHPQAPSLFSGLKKNLAKAAGLTDKQMEDLIEHFSTSGRGYMRGAVVEDPNALPGVRSKIGKVADFVRIPYYAGENFAATVSRITAYLDVLERNPKLDPKSAGFWKMVQDRDRTLSFGLNRAQASMAQSDSIARVLTQWTSYFFRAFETVLFDKSLTKVERARLAASMTILWGYGGMGLSEYVDFGDGEFDDFMKNGPIDYVLTETAGVSIGDRLAINIPDLIARGTGFFIDPKVNIPGATIVGETAMRGWSALSHFVQGRGQLGAYELARLIRINKLIDDGWMGYTMMMEDVRKSRTGTTLEGDFTSFQAFAQAMGLRPNEAVEFERVNSILFKQTERRKRAIKYGTETFKFAIAAGEKGDWETFSEYVLDTAAILDSYDLSPMYRSDAVKAIIREASSDRVERVLNMYVRAGYDKEALSFMEGLE